MSFFTRVIGLHIDEPRIGIHLAQSVISEYSRGRISHLEAMQMIGIDDPGEVDEFNRVLFLISQAQSPINMSQRVFNYLCLGEMQRKSPSRDYTDEANFWEMMEQESMASG